MVANVPADVHRLVQNPEDVDRTLAGKTIEDEMSPTTLVPCDMERAQATLNLVASVAVGHKRIGGQCSERADERFAIDGCLSAPELLGRPLKDGHKVCSAGWDRRMRQRRRRCATS